MMLMEEWRREGWNRMGRRWGSWNRGLLAEDCPWVTRGKAPGEKGLALDRTCQEGSG